MKSISKHKKILPIAISRLGNSKYQAARQISNTAKPTYKPSSSVWAGNKFGRIELKFTVKIIDKKDAPTIIKNCWNENWVQKKTRINPTRTKGRK
jgi:hypothetical protein